MPALKELQRVALRFCEKAARREDLEVAQEEFDLSRARAKMVKKKVDEQNDKTPWVPVVASTSQTTSEVVAAVTSLGRKVDSLAEILLHSLDQVTAILHGFRNVSLILPGL